MSVYASSGSPVARPQQYHTLPTALISQAEQQDRSLKSTELRALANYFRSGAKRLEVATTIGAHASEIVEAGANRIFYGGSPMAYLDPPFNRDQLPGYTLPPRPFTRSKDGQTLNLNLKLPQYGNPLRGFSQWLQTQLSQDRDPLPDGFRPINISRYGVARMKRSMRDLDWFLRYVTYAIVADDSSILTVNARGLRGVIPEDVTEATIVALREMRWRTLGYFQQDAEAKAMIQEQFDALIAAYQVEKPPVQLRIGVSNQQQGLKLPESYALAATTRPKFVMKPQMAETEKQAVIKAAYRQVFERDITREYGVALTGLESRFRSNEFSTKEFIRQLGKSRLYRDLFYEPFTISRVIELAVRHFLGRGLYSLEEFQQYFDVITQGGLSALIDALIDSTEYTDYFGEETVPYLRGLGQEAQECRNWGAQINLFKYSAMARKLPQFVTLFGEYQKPLPNQHPYGAGNDPLEIQFGAIFPDQDQDGGEHPAYYKREHRRILIHCDWQNGNGAHSIWQSVPGSEHRVLKLTSLSHRPHPTADVDLSAPSPTAVIQAAYRQVFGRDLLADQRLTTAESLFKAQQISVREFVRQLAKSRLFRSLFWDSLYVTKAIEYIHRRLLGRPTYGREEMGRYYDIAAKQGFYALVNAIIDSSEYSQTFGENTVPYERMITPKGLEMRLSPQVRATHRAREEERVYEGKWMKAALEHHTSAEYHAHLNGKNGKLTAFDLQQVKGNSDAETVPFTPEKNEVEHPNSQADQIQPAADPNQPSDPGYVEASVSNQAG
nr:MAG: photosystem I reaction center subunit XI [Leptolyngbya sp. IPPAS B-1204]